MFRWHRARAVHPRTQKALRSKEVRGFRLVDEESARRCDMLKKNSGSPYAQQRLPRVARCVVLVVLALGSILASTEVGAQSTRQEEVAKRGAQVIPFDLEQTM